MPTPYGEFVPDPLSPSGYRWKRHDEPEPTGLLPAVNPAVEQPAQLPAVEQDEPGDVGDLVDPNAADPTPEEITHPDHSDYVEPWRPEAGYAAWYRSIGAEPA